MVLGAYRGAGLMLRVVQGMPAKQLRRQGLEVHGGGTVSGRAPVGAVRVRQSSGPRQGRE
jgi:hypothetical protein